MSDKDNTRLFAPDNWPPQRADMEALLTAALKRGEPIPVQSTSPLDRTYNCVGGLRCVMREGQCDTCPNRPEVTEDIEAEVIEPKRLEE